MKYHEIGEIFEHDGVLLEVVNSPTTNWIDTCCRCYFYNTCTHEDIKCTRSTRKDNRDIVFNRIEASDIREIREKAIFGSIDTFFTDRELKILKLIDKQKETKDMEQKTEIKVEGKDETFASVTEPVTDGKGTGDVCKAGEVFVCVNDVIDGDNVTRFTKGKTYVCDTDNVLRNDNGTEEDWSGCVGFTDAFVRLDDGFHTCLDHAEIPKKERVNHPDYYNRHPSGVECITIIRHHNFNIGSVIKYCWRNGLKTEEGMSDKDKQIEDLKKAIFYLNDEIKRLEEF